MKATIVQGRPTGTEIAPGAAPIRKPLCWLLVAACFLAKTPSANGIGCDAVGHIFPPRVSETAPFVRFSFPGSGNTNATETWNYFTVDGPSGPYGPALAGVHYTAVSGSITFAPGQGGTNIDVPLIDNGLVDGFKAFSMVVIRGGYTNIDTMIIDDNELPSTVDPLFAPDFGAGLARILPLPDGRALVARTMIQTNGWVDPSFVAAPNADPLQVLGDGHIFAQRNGPGGNELLRLLPTGALETVFMIPNFTEFAAAQPDGRMLIVVTNNNSRLLQRLNTDGTIDAGFTAWPLGDTSIASSKFAFQADGKILIGAAYPTAVLGPSGPANLIRLNADGSPDGSFSPPADVAAFLLRNNGKVLVRSGGTVVQLNDNGSVDATFQLTPYPNEVPPLPQVELPDGRLLAPINFGAHSIVRRWNSDGTWDATYPSAIGGGFNPPCTVYFGLSMVNAGYNIFIKGANMTDVDGFPRGLARLLPNPPERDFRLLTPSESFRSSGAAHIQVLRTGPTVDAASVSFATSDDTATANVDYVPQNGMLNFAPLEVSKEVVVPLLPRTGIMDRITFKLELSSPSPGYSTIPATPIAILPDFRLVSESLQVTNGIMTLQLEGTVPGHIYSLDTSTNLTSWSPLTSSGATGPTTIFQFSKPEGPVRFFRAR